MVAFSLLIAHPVFVLECASSRTNDIQPNPKSEVQISKNLSYAPHFCAPTGVSGFPLLNTKVAYAPAACSLIPDRATFASRSSSIWRGVSACVGARRLARCPVLSAWAHRSGDRAMSRCLPCRPNHILSLSLLCTKV